jgi:hypothetical protein
MSTSLSPCEFFLVLAAVLAPASAMAADATEPPATENRDDQQAEPAATEHRDDEQAHAHQEESTPQASAPKIDEQRAAIASYYAGFHLGIDPGAVFGNGKVGFAIALRLEYGFDTGSVIVAPGVSLAAYFLDPNVYMGMPTVKLALPIGWFVPFVEGGAGVGQVTQPSTTGLALLGAGGFMIHASPHLALGVEAGYEAILGTDFGVIILSPVLALAF